MDPLPTIDLQLPCKANNHKTIKENENTNEKPNEYLKCKVNQCDCKAIYKTEMLCRKHYTQKRRANEIRVLALIISFFLFYFLFVFL